MTHLQQLAIDRILRSQSNDGPRGTEHAAAAEVDIHATSHGDAQLFVSDQLLNKACLLLLAETDTA